jgi:acetylglutamate kinase
MENITQKAKVLHEALPYLQSIQGKIVVIKYGGQILVGAKQKRSFLKDIVLLKSLGAYPVVLHGGGPSITKEMSRRKIVVEFVDGHRVTDAETVKIVESVFKKNNKQIVDTINKFGAKSKGLIGNSEKIFNVIQRNKKLGLVGEIKKVETKKILKLIKEGYIPVISPLGIDRRGVSYNINADTAASSLSVALKAGKLTLVSDVDGVYDGKKFLIHLTIKDSYRLMKKGIISRGMIPKVEACIYALQNGVEKAHLINGLRDHSLFFEIFTDRGAGTDITK